MQHSIVHRLPHLPLKFRFEDGSLAPGAAQYLGNAVYHMNKAQREYDYQNLSIGVDADWTILPGLSFKPALFFICK